MLPVEQPDPSVGSARPIRRQPCLHAGYQVTRRGTLVTLLIALAFGAFLLWSTLSSQHTECAVTVTYGGVSASGKASAATEEDAVREAQTAACGPISRGMNDRIACGRTPPASRRCRTL